MDRKKAGREPGAAPVGGMGGAGARARMTSAAATGLGLRFRVLAAAADESAAQVTADVMVGDHGSRADLLAFAADCDVIPFDHEHVAGPLINAIEQAGHPVRPGSQALRYTQSKRAMRERLTALGYR